MKDEDLKRKVEKLLRKEGSSSIEAFVEDGIVYLNGQVDSWNRIVELGHKVGKLKNVEEVVNDVALKEAVKEKREAKLKLQRKVYNPILPKKADVVIIGGGVTGCFIVRELSRYKLDMVLLEKECDVGGGATKANSAQIHTGIGESFGTLKRKLCVKAWPMFDKIAEELDIPYKKNGLLIVITRESLSKKIPSFLRNFLSKYMISLLLLIIGRTVGDHPKIVKKRELLKMEPYLTDKALVGVLMPSYGVIDPFRFTVALAENAVQNGVNILLDTEVTGIEVKDGEVRGVITTRGIVETNFIINAAGVYADKIAEMAGAKEFTIHPRKGSIILFDKKVKEYSTRQLNEFKLPRDEYTKGGGVLKTVDGNVNFGPSATEVPNKEDTSVTREEIEKILEKYGSIFSSFPNRSVITYFAGLRACTYKEDFFIRASKKVKGFINVAGIQSPGLTASPAIAEMVLKILESEGLHIEEKDGFSPTYKRPIVFKELVLEEKKKLAKDNPPYGNVVCRCEHVTEGEVVKAVHSPVPALTIDAVKRRTRAGMGRCQGGFCGPLVAKILANELNIPLEEVTKSGGNSRLFIQNTKYLLTED